MTYRMDKMCYISRSQPPSMGFEHRLWNGKLYVFRRLYSIGHTDKIKLSYTLKYFILEV